MEQHILSNTYWDSAFDIEDNLSLFVGKRFKNIFTLVLGVCTCSKIMAECNSYV